MALPPPYSGSPQPSFTVHPDPPSRRAHSSHEPRPKAPPAFPLLCPYCAYSIDAYKPSKLVGKTCLRCRKAKLAYHFPRHR